MYNVHILIIFIFSYAPMSSLSTIFHLQFSTRPLKSLHLNSCFLLYFLSGIYLEDLHNLIHKVCKLQRKTRDKSYEDSSSSSLTQEVVVPSRTFNPPSIFYAFRVVVRALSRYSFYRLFVVHLVMFTLPIDTLTRYHITMHNYFPVF